MVNQNVLVNESALQSLADNIRSQNQTTDKIKPSEMIDSIAELYVEGQGLGNLTEDQYLSKSATEYTNENNTIIGSYAFAAFDKLQTVECPKLMIIKESAFRDCTSLTSVSSSNLYKIEDNAFYSDKALSSIDLSNAVEIGKYAFAYCKSLKEVSLPKATHIGDHAFQNCYCTKISAPLITEIPSSFAAQLSFDSSALKELDINWNNITKIGSSAFSSVNFSLLGYTDINTPNATELGQSAFYKTSITSITANNVEFVRNSCFNNCTSLKSAELKNATIIETDAFAYCSSLTSIDIPNVETIQARAFNSARVSKIDLHKKAKIYSLPASSYLKTLILRSSEKCITSSAVTLSSTTKLYVPATLVDEYKADSILGKCTILSIEDNPDVCE